MDQVEEGVANFRNFSEQAQLFFTTQRVREEEKAKVDRRRAKIHYALLTLLSGLIVALFTFLLTHYDSKKQTTFFPSAQSSQVEP